MKLIDRDICARIKMARRMSGISQTELAEMLGVQQRSISNYESHRVPWRLLNEIAEATGQPTEWLLYGEQPTKKDTL